MVFLLNGRSVLRSVWPFITFLPLHPPERGCKEKEIKTMSGSVLIPMGMSYKVSPVAGKGVIWELKRYGREITKGFSKNETEAKKDLMVFLLEYTGSEAAKGWKKGEARKKIRDLATRRPYLVEHVLGSLMAGGILGDVIEQAEEKEKEGFAHDKSKFKVPIPNHHLTLSARTAAMRIVESLRILGLFGEDTPSARLPAWVKKMGLVRQEI